MTEFNLLERNAPFPISKSLLIEEVFGLKITELTSLYANASIHIADTVSGIVTN